MSFFFNVVSFVGTLLVLVLAVVGAVVVRGMLCRDLRERRADARAREAEQQIRDIGHEAQLRIMREAVRQASRSRSTGPMPGEWE